MGRKRREPWDTLFSAVRVSRMGRSIYPPKPTPADLDDAEAELGCKLPAAYRAFAEGFGLHGTLMGWVRLFPVVCPPRAHLVTMQEETRAFRKLPARGHRELVRRLVYIGRDYHDRKYGFDPQDVTDADRTDYRYYMFAEKSWDYPAAVFEPVADSFAGFVRWVVNDVRTEHPAYDHGDPSTIRYSLFALWGKRRPTQREVAGWLLWNNGTVRGIARSIREDGRTDAFPILADALEDAGCRNKHFLDSCRTGDPDIDGEWVLEVLLGRERSRR